MTVVRYDPRGMGMSGRDDVDFTVEAATRDLEAVLESLRLERFAVYGRPSMGDLPLSYAARHPERVTHLVLTWWTAFMLDATPSLSALADENWELFTNILARIITGWDSTDATPFAALIRASHSPQTFRPAWAAMTSSDSLALAPHVAVPTLFLYSLAAEGTTYAAAITRLAAEIAGAQIVGVPGEFNASYPNVAGIALMHDFITRPARPGQAVAAPEIDTSVFRTILFTDIVEHTQMMERLGDDAGREVLREHERITRDALREHGGAEIKTIGDSFMASFPSAQRALECAIALQRAFAAQEVCGEQVRIRAGVNAGEPITEGEDLFGASVNPGGTFERERGRGRDRRDGRRTTARGGQGLLVFAAGRSGPAWLRGAGAVV